MSSVVNAISKCRQDEQALRAMTERALGAPIADFACKELAGGLCNAVYRVDADGRRLVLKIAPEASVVVMRHERDILRTEAEMLRYAWVHGTFTDELARFDALADEICG